MWTSLDIKTRHVCFKKRFINDSTATLFMSQISSDSVDALLDSFNSSVMDEIAPVKVKTMSCQQEAPWRNGTATPKEIM